MFHIFVKLSDNIRSSRKPQPVLFRVSQRREAVDTRLYSRTLLIFLLICLLGLTYILVEALRRLEHFTLILTQGNWSCQLYLFSALRESQYYRLKQFMKMFLSVERLHLDIGVKCGHFISVFHLTFLCSKCTSMVIITLFEKGTSFVTV